MLIDTEEKIAGETRLERVMEFLEDYPGNTDFEEGVRAGLKLAVLIYQDGYWDEQDKWHEGKVNEK